MFVCEREITLHTYKRGAWIPFWSMHVAQGDNPLGGAFDEHFIWWNKDVKALAYSELM